MKRLTSLIIAVSLCLGAAAVKAQDIKVGFVNSAMLLEEAPQADAARKKLEKEFAPREKEIVSIQETLRELEEKIQRDGATWSEAEKSRQEREFNRRVRELQRYQAEFRDDLNLRRNEELGKLQRQIIQVIVDLAKSEGYDLIVSESVVFASTRIDITDTVLERLRQLSAQGQ